MNYVESNQHIPDRVYFNEADQLDLKSQNYEVICRIGAGGFGEVYKVSDSNKQVKALKILRLWEVLPTHISLLKDRFQREFDVGLLESRYILKNHAHGFIKGNPYIIMEYCPNGTLASHLSLFSKESYSKQFCGSLMSAIKCLHDKSIIHRDIKVANILYDISNTPKLADFGLAANLNNRLTQTNIFGRIREEQKIGLGHSIGFSPPEQFKESAYFKLTKPTMDIFALGATMYYALTNGSLPFGEINSDDKLTSSKYQENQRSFKFDSSPLIEKSNEDWIPFLQKCLQTDPKNRFQTIDEAARFLNINMDDYQFSPALQWSDSTKIKILKGSTSNCDYDLDQILNKKNNKCITIGRINDNGVLNDISLQESFISKRHATIEKLHDGWYIRDGQYDLDSVDYWSFSMNGIQVNNIQLTQENMIKLKNGDHICIGSHEMIFSS